MNRQTMMGIELVAAGQASLLMASRHITGCAACNAYASQTFQSVMVRTLGCTGTTEYFMCCRTQCPRCRSSIVESTLVSTDNDIQVIDIQVIDENLNTFEVPLAETNVVFVDAPTLLQAQEFISGCEYCAPEAAEITFDYLLDAVTGCDPSATDYVVCHTARCPCCNHEVAEKTLVVTLEQ